MDEFERAGRLRGGCAKRWWGGEVLGVHSALLPPLLARAGRDLVLEEVGEFRFLLKFKQRSQGRAY